MPHRPDNARNRAVLALHALVGGRAVQEHMPEPGIPVALTVSSAKLMLVAGDNQAPLDWTRLKPLAVVRRIDVLGMATDPYVSGHRFLIDAVLFRKGAATLYPEYRLWLGANGVLALVRQTGDGPAIALRPGGLTPAVTQPFKNKVGLTTGLARGQARLQELVHGDTPFATAQDRYLSR